MKFQKKTGQLLITGEEWEWDCLKRIIGGAEKFWEQHSQNQIGEINLLLAGKSNIGRPYKEKNTPEMRKQLEQRKDELMKEYQITKALLKSLETGATTETD